MRTADANRMLYAEHAAVYDETEHCIAQERVRELLDGMLDRALAEIDADQPTVLDACGGTGNVSELLARRGLRTTLVDLSPEMLAAWRTKAEAMGVEAETVEAEIDVFLDEEDRPWDMIVFSSALHHLDDYAAVARLAARRLAPGGVLLTAFDPVRTDDRWTHRLRRLDYLLSLAVSPPRLLDALRRRSAARGSSGPSFGELAERHALEGVDDRAIVAAVEAEGLAVVEHSRYACQRYRAVEWLIDSTGRSTTFHLIARKLG